MALQDEIGVFSSKLSERVPEILGGVWIQHQPEYRVVVGLTRGDRTTLEPYTEGITFESSLITVRSEYALTDLRWAAEQYARDHSRERFDLWIDEVMSRVVVTAPSSRDADQLNSKRALQRTLESSDPNRTKTSGAFRFRVGRLGRPTEIYAGLVLNSPLGCCRTSGFSVQDTPTGPYGISSAGHSPNQLSFQGTNLEFVESDQSGSQDVQWHKTPNIADKPWARDNSPDGHRDIVDFKPWSEMNVGDVVCKYGITTGFDCGNMTSRFYRPPYITNPDPTFLLVDGANDMSEPGDSGGPVYHAEKAWALISGDRPNGEGIYMPIEFMWRNSNLDVRLRLA